MTLSAYVSGRDNNFNLIRAIAAFAVLFTHSFSIAVGSQAAEPTISLLAGMSPGGIAVDLFFITSGFLVTASLILRRNAIDFIVARALRIFPALIVALTISAFILGPYFTNLPLGVYFSDSVLYWYLLKSGTLFYQIAYDLPGVFNENPYKNVVNGSLWSMKHEVRLYALLAFVWIAGYMVRPKIKVQIFQISVIVLAVIFIAYVLNIYIKYGTISHALKLASLFFSGGAYYVIKEYIPLSKRLFIFLVAILMLGGLVGGIAFYLSYIVALPYLLFYVAYVPKGYVRKYNNFGDYSYGVYIYAFPIQQSIAALVPGIAPLQMFLVSGAVTLACAVVSWHLVEERALGLKEYLGMKKDLIFTRKHSE